MNWRNLFLSRHTLWLEEECQRLREDHLRQVEDLKKSYASQLSYVIEENQKLKDDMDRLRLLLTPALQNVELPKERSTLPPAPDFETVTGTPWDRIRAREIAADEARWKKRHVKPVATAPEGESNGVFSEGRNDASLGGASKTA